MDLSKSITFGNDTLGTGDTSVLTKVRAGGQPCVPRAKYRVHCDKQGRCLLHLGGDKFGDNRVGGGGRR